MSLLDILNAEQHKAVTTTEGPLLVLAGAGSGKTRVIAHRIAYLIQEKQIRPEKILAVTFTNKASQEMGSRVENLLLNSGSKALSSPLIATFHSFCVRVLRQHIDKLPISKYGTAYDRNFTIYDSDDQARMVKSCIKDLEIDEKMTPVRMVQASISSSKNRGLGWESFASNAQRQYGEDLKKETIGRIYKLYEQKLISSNALDFDDLLLKTVQLLQHSTEIRDHYNHRFSYILIDEYQDTNPPQFALIKLLTEKTQNLCVVGDPDQSIYRFRAADIQNILDFEKHFPKAEVIKLTENYRSTKLILDAANNLIRNNEQRREKDLRTSNEVGTNIRYYQAYDGENEAEFVINRIQRHLREEPNIRCVVLYRTNAQSRLFEEACRRVGVRYNIVGGFSFYERAEIKDIVAYLKLLLNPSDNVALSRIINVPARGIGKTTWDLIETTAAQERISYWDAISMLTTTNKAAGRSLAVLLTFRDLVEKLQALTDNCSLSSIVKLVIDKTGYAQMLKAENTPEAEGRLLNLDELVNAAVESENRDETLRNFIDSATLVSDSDSYDGEIPVTLMTIHSAKGLEFPVVFLVGLEQGLFPHSRSFSDSAELEEERRLCYVGITRAEKQLYITHSLTRRVYGEESSCEPSQFLSELPLESLEDLSRANSWLKSVRAGLIPKRSSTASFATKRFGNTNFATKKQNTYTGRTYNSVDSVKEFFNKQEKDTGSTPNKNTNRITIPEKTTKTEPSMMTGIDVYATQKLAPVSMSKPITGVTTFKPGMRVKHPKYGEGLVLRREGEGEHAKLLISFPGFGQKKIQEKFANLVKA
ncbi:MAG: UvrD-helicase domain-containing protein [Blastocatellia bacterium]|nr:UvrD-helicase domain-containing protein [Blastocatellia bacterium]MBN8724055.1 UvrD-helicase domain-containing protein [Acidobacteriota bacterium]